MLPVTPEYLFYREDRGNFDIAQLFTTNKKNYMDYFIISRQNICGLKNRKHTAAGRPAEQFPCRNDCILPYFRNDFNEK